MPQIQPAPSRPAKMNKTQTARWVIASLAQSLINLPLPIEFPYASTANATYIKQEIWAVWRAQRRRAQSNKPLPKIIQRDNVLRFIPFKEEMNTND